ncbi:MAG TPA: response regulator transcription factor, partial [Candidatus Acidoferrum sp.]|nr:response regulator transcription factor [Candidatus Acidoferrum sp.]
MNTQRKPGARLLLADDHRLLADACKNMLEPEYQVVGVDTDGRSLVKSALTLKPDVVILDIAMPHLNGLDAAQQIKQKLPSAKLIFLTMNQAPEVAAEAFRRGASAFVLKQSAADELVTAVRTVLRGESYLSPLVARETVNFLLHQAKPLTEESPITTRQSEILQLLAEGMSMKEVANELNLK